MRRNSYAEVGREGTGAAWAGRRNETLRLAGRFGALLAVGLPLLACNAHGSAAGGGGLSVADRASTAGVCVTVSGGVATAVNVGIQLAAQSVTPAQAQAQLTPVLAKLSTVASQNSALPVGKTLQHLVDTITAATQTAPTDVTAIRAAASSLGSAGKDVLASCADAAR